jgi:hypothetical protein
MLFFLIFSSSVAFCHGYNLRPNGKNMCNKKWGKQIKKRRGKDGETNASLFSFGAFFAQNLFFCKVLFAFKLLF